MNIIKVGSLVAESASILMQRTPKQLDNKLADCYQKVMSLEGVQGVQVSHLKEARKGIFLTTAVPLKAD